MQVFTEDTGKQKWWIKKNHSWTDHTIF